MKLVHFMSVTAALVAVLGVSNGEDPFTCKGAGPFCYDCNTATICRPWANGTFSEVLPRIKCPPEAPNCNYLTGTCSIKTDDRCGEPDDFLCLRPNGHFPDAYDCSTFHVCHNSESRKFHCPPGIIYNADSKKCDPKIVYCAPPICLNVGLQVKFPQHPSYYAYCREKGEVVTVTRCDGVYQFNETAQRCEATCNPKCDGLLPNYDDCTTYNECKTVWFNETLSFVTRTLKKCPLDTYFDPSQFTCVGGDDVSRKICKPQPDEVETAREKRMEIDPRFFTV